MRRPFLIDTDTASDDAVALLMALAADDVSVQAITVVAGNVPLAQGSANARFTVELAGAGVPVYEGAAAPLMRDPLTAEWFHGKDGLGDAGYGPPKTPAAPGHAVDVIIETARRHEGLTLVTLGPLTNVALALAKAPDIAERIGRAVVMGGAACTGERDPGRRVQHLVRSRSGAMCLLAAPHRDGRLGALPWPGRAGAADIARVEAQRRKRPGSPSVHRHALEVNRRLFHEDGIGLPDLIAMAVARSEHRPSAVRTPSTSSARAHSPAVTVVDQLDVVRGGLANHSGFPTSLAARPPNVNVCWEIDCDRWKALLLRLLSRFSALS
jgi:purine nucleosidase